MERFTVTDNVIMMMIIGSIMPIIGANITRVIGLIPVFLGSFGDWIKCRIWGKVNSITIHHTQILAGKQPRIITPDDEIDNDKIIESILQVVGKKNLIFKSASLKVGPGEAGTVDMYEFFRRRHLLVIPSGTFTYNDFEFSLKKTQTNNDKDSMHKIENVLTIKSKLPSDNIKKFVNECWLEYCKTVYDKVDKISQQYFYLQAKHKEHDLSFSRYNMNNKSTFDNIFFPEKAKIIEMIDNLQSGKLKKLSLLLHGPPGTGKTSIIKAIAHYTGRNVISIKLSLIKNDSVLMDAFYSPSLSYYKDNDETRSRNHDYISFAKRIYILEDIDAECDIIKQREKEDHVPEIKAKDIKTKYMDILDQYLFKGPTLSGILNTLDGVLELNDAIIIMTTNYVEKLDSALIRPGRITMNIGMKKMLGRDANMLICKHFGKPINKLDDYMFTAAALESYIQQAANTNELIDIIYDCVKK